MTKRNRRHAADWLRRAAGHAQKALECMQAASRLTGENTLRPMYSGAPVCPAAPAVLNRLAERVESET